MRGKVRGGGIEERGRRLDDETDVELCMALIPL